jgi:nucleoside-diphosphate kinase
MNGNYTFTIIKPDAVGKKSSGAILQMISDAGFWIAGMKMIRLSKLQAGYFYEIHKSRPFYDGLVEFMSSGPIIVAVLEKDNAVEDFRKLIGNTDPAKADEGSIRKRYAESIQKNAVHGSDSNENAKREAGFFFAQQECTNRSGDYLEL